METKEVILMKKQALQFFVFSFICFIAVFLFGSILGPLQKIYDDPKVMRNLNLFHNHFDQLCWLGAAAIGAVLYANRDRFNGSERILRLFTLSYMLGTAFFSFAFFVRALGLMIISKALENGAYTGLLTIGGLFNIITIFSGIYIVTKILSGRTVAPY